MCTCLLAAVALIVTLADLAGRRYFARARGAPSLPRTPEQFCRPLNNSAGRSTEARSLARPIATLI
jgi:hypothetical protein